MIIYTKTQSIHMWVEIRLNVCLAGTQFDSLIYSRQFVRAAPILFGIWEFATSLGHI